MYLRSINIGFMTNPFVILFGLIWFIELYLFGMQRASLLIARDNNVEWRGLGDKLLPNWFPLTWIVRILKYGVFIAIIIFVDWQMAIVLLLISFIIKSTIPIPYKILYRKIFRAEVTKMKYLNNNIGHMLEDMLNKSGF